MLKKTELFNLGCTILLRYWPVLRQNHGVDWKIIIDLIGQNIDLSAHLSIDLLNEISRGNDQNTRFIAKSGVIKYIFFSYVPATLRDKFNLYKAIKLLRTVTAVDKTVVREREGILARIIELYEEYVPTVSDISAKCYEGDYCK